MMMIIVKEKLVIHFGWNFILFATNLTCFLASRFHVGSCEQSLSSLHVPSHILLTPVPYLSLYQSLRSESIFQSSLAASLLTEVPYKVIHMNRHSHDNDQ
jgi:hypothetical protein